MKECTKLEKQLVDWSITLDFNLSWVDTIGLKTTEERFLVIKEKVRELEDVINDSISSPSCTIGLYKITKDLCSHCKEEWEEYYDHDLGYSCCAHCGDKIEVKEKD